MRRRRFATILIFIWAGGFALYSLGPERTSAEGPREEVAAGPAAVGKPFPPGISLDCARCHGPETTLPYLAGEKFHKDVHGQYDGGIHAQPGSDAKPRAACVDCHTTDGDMASVFPSSDARSTTFRANIAETCGKCHGDRSVMQGSGISDRPVLSYRESVHARAVALGNSKAAVCTDCHGGHAILPASDPSSPIAKINVLRTCGQCHEKESAEFSPSVHGEAVARGVSRAPTCTDCHGIHAISRPGDTAGSSPSGAAATESCAKCHEGVTLTEEYGVAGGRVSSYRDSYHGLASRMGSKAVANCSSCHGVHNILPSSDPNSMVSASRLEQTCGQCHIGAGENFTKGKIHLASNLVTGTDDSDIAAAGTRIVRWIYLPMIVVVITGMFLHNALIWWKKTRAKRRVDRKVVRLTGNQRLQHWCLLISFFALVVSGFALQYPETWLASLLDETARRVIHRAAAILMLAVGAYHIVYLLITRDGRLWLKDMVPQWKDVKDVIGNFAYYLGLSSVKPKIARFGYAEKAEYWAVIWGTVIMGLTGMMIWFKIDIFGFLPRWWIEIALAVHFYEAILATLSIIVWHFYQVIFDPDVYPLNFAVIDGRVSEEAYREEHEAAYEEMIEARLSELNEKGATDSSEEKPD